MSTLRVVVEADGVSRKFRGDGDGPALVAAFRVWLASPDFWFPMAAGADEIDEQAARLEVGQDAPVIDREAGDVLPVDGRLMPAAVPTPAEPADPSEASKLRKAVSWALSSGASYDPREIARAIRTDYPGISADAVVPVLEHLVRDRRVTRIPVGAGLVRYQKTKLLETPGVRA